MTETNRIEKDKFNMNKLKTKMKLHWTLSHSITLIFSSFSSKFEAQRSYSLFFTKKVFICVHIYAQQLPLNNKLITKQLKNLLKN